MFDKEMLFSCLFNKSKPKSLEEKNNCAEKKSSRGEVEKKNMKW